MELKPYLDNDFYIKESRDMITVVQSMIIAGNYQLLLLSFEPEHSSDEKMLDHTQKCHVDGSAACPFCGLTGTSSAELLLHVNQAHLDYLTPENELMSFIDDSKSADGDSDSMSCGLSPSITEIPGITTTTNNHELTATISLENGTKSKNLTNGTNGIKHQPATVTAVKSKTQPYTGTCTKVSNGKISNGMTNGSCKPEPVIFTYNSVMDDNNNSNNEL
jgi:hypothetical protein